MSVFSHVELPPAGQFGFRPVLSADSGLRRGFAAVGRLPAGDLHPTHLHHGEEVLCVLDGKVDVRVGDERRSCGPGDVVAVPGGTWHTMRVVVEAVLVVSAERGMGNAYRVRRPDGSRREVEVYRRELPWSRQPPAGTGWTTDEELAAIMAAIDPDL